MPDRERQIPLHQVLQLTPEEEARLLDLLGHRGAKTELVVVATESRELAKSLRDVIERDLADRQDAHDFDNLVAALTPRMRIPTPTVLPRRAAMPWRAWSSWRSSGR